MKSIFLILALFLALYSAQAKDEKKPEKKDPVSAEILNGLKFRNIGPAVTSGRIIDIAVDDKQTDTWYVAVACGGVWKTTNHGVSFSPIFDDNGVYSIGCVTIDPKNSNVIWVGSGENNSQRSVGYGNGIYKSIDAGKSWKKMGLEKSEHIGKIIVDPRNSNRVYVAVQGPLWGPGGDRGFYLTDDGGKTWKKTLDISENTGVSDIVYDPRKPDIMYASSYQRRRHVWTLINGGPESALYKSYDAGTTWEKITNGLPSGYVGRIGLAISPVNPDKVYALVEASGDNGGFFRSTNAGGSWEKMYGLKTVSAQYYQEIFTDPINEDKVFSVDTYTKYTLDGGKTWINLGLKERHVDDHAFWIDKKNTNHIIIGGDGGLYESYDLGSNWRFFENLPIAQFYRVTADNDYPFYSVYGGTQDNNTLGAPARTLNSGGIYNDDWIFTVGGDGFKTVIDPTDANIIYSQPQHGWLVRFDKKSGESVGIQPQPQLGEEHRWNWDTPVIISPFDHKTLYFAANKLFKSTDRGNSWKKISGDLTRQIDRNQLKVMGKVWDPDAVAKNASTSLYGNIVSLSESPKKKGLLYIGTDDGLIQVSEDDGSNWTKISTFLGVPETTYVTDVEASLHDENVVYATFDNHKNADFKPYALKSIDKGRTWTSISANLPENGPVHTIAQDHVDPNLLFVGTEFGAFYTNDGGKKWIQLKNGLAPIAIKDIDIQRRENDLILGSFGRGIYILDDYSPLRSVNEELVNKSAFVFPVKDALLYIEREDKGRRSLGETYFRGENAPFGATFTYYLKEKPETLKDKRLKAQKEFEDKKQDAPYPSFTELRNEDLEEAPYLYFIVKDTKGEVVRRLTAPASTGVNRLVWDLRYPDYSPVDKNTNINKRSGFPVAPGTYSVEMLLAKDGEISKLTEPVSFNVKTIDNRVLPAEDVPALADFRKKAADMQRLVYGLNRSLSETKTKLDDIRTSISAFSPDNSLLIDARKLALELEEINVKINGNSSIASRNESQTPSLYERFDNLLWSSWSSTSEPTKTNKDVLNLLDKEMKSLSVTLNALVNGRLASIEKKMDELKMPWTPGRLPIGE